MGCYYWSIKRKTIDSVCDWGFCAFWIDHRLNVNSPYWINKFSEHKRLCLSITCRYFVLVNVYAPHWNVSHNACNLYSKYIHGITSRKIAFQIEKMPFGGVITRSEMLLDEQKLNSDAKKHTIETSNYCYFFCGEPTHGCFYLFLFCLALAYKR